MSTHQRISTESAAGGESQAGNRQSVVAGSGIGNLTYVVTATNNGPGAATGVVIDESFTLPTGVSVDTITASVGGFSGTTWTLGALAPGASETLTVVLTVGSAASIGTDVISNTATLTGVTETDTVPGNDSVTEATSIVRLVDIELTKTESIDPVVAGSGPGNLTYVVTATNNRPSDASGVAVAESLTLPAGVTVDSIMSSAGTSFADPTWTIGDLASGASATLTIVLTVDGSAVAGTDVISDTATVTAVGEIDTVPGNDVVTESTSITVSAPIPGIVSRVRVRLTDADYLQLAAVEIIEAGTGTNLALTGTATQSSQLYVDGGPTAAIDGDSTSNRPSVAITKEQFGAWWEVDLGGEFDVSSITIFNRLSNGRRIEAAAVEAFDIGGAVVWAGTITGAVDGKQALICLRT